LDAITLVEGQQTHVVVNPPTDLLNLQRCYITNGDTLRPVVPVSLVPASASLLGPPNFVAYMDSDQSVSPAEIWFEKKFAAGGYSWQFWAWYKKSTPDLTGAINTSGALMMPDDYFQVFREGCLYYAFKWATDPRAGGAQVELGGNGQRTVAYTGQLGVFRAAIEEVRQQETLIRDFAEDKNLSMKGR